MLSVHTITRTGVFLAFLFTLVFTIGCEKTPLDYRAGYIGTYNFHVETSYGYPGGITGDTSYDVEGKINYGTKKNTISITWQGLNTIAYPELYEDASFSGNGVNGEFLSRKEVVFQAIFGSISWTEKYSVSGKKK